MRRLPFLSAILGMAITGYAAPPGIVWQNNLPMHSREMTQTIDSGFIVAGGDSNMVLLRLDPLGHEVWQKTYGGNSGDTGKSVDAIADGGFIAAATSLSGSARARIWVVRTNGAGDTLWTLYFGDSVRTCHAGCVRSTHDGGFIVSGTLKRTISISTTCEGCLIRIDNAGKIAWIKTYPDDFFNGVLLGESVCELSGGGFAFCGGSGAIRTDSGGTVLWSREFTTWVTDHGAYANTLKCVDASLDTGFVACGWALDPDYFTTISNIYTNIWIVKLPPASNGYPLWFKTFGRASSYKEYGYGIHRSTDSGYIVCGLWSNDAWLARTDRTGTLTWSLSLAATDGAFIKAFQTPDSGIAALRSYTLVKFSYDSVFNPVLRPVPAQRRFSPGTAAGDAVYTISGRRIPSGRPVPPGVVILPSRKLFFVR
jgi:hypothetical protein